jgi:hypothetical protein
MRQVQAQLEAMMPVELAKQYRETTVELSKSALVLGKTRRRFRPGARGS